MDEKENVGFEDFETALFGEDYQFDGDSDFEEDNTDGAADDVSDDSAEAEDLEDEDVSDSEDEEEEPDKEDSAEVTAEEETGDHGEEDPGETFTLKVNKEERTVTREEMIALAQKGADYDRVKEQNAKSQQTIQDLQTQLGDYNDKKSVLDILGFVAEKTGTSLESLAEMLYLNVRKSAGASEALAKEELMRAKAEKELNGFKAQKAQSEQKEESAETRATREIEAFKKDYPDVKLTEELIAKLTPDLQKGTSLSAAYRNLEKAAADAKIKDLEQKLAAQIQNDKNKKKSPGSQKDSGGRRTRSDYEEFEKALFG